MALNSHRFSANTNYERHYEGRANDTESIYEKIDLPELHSEVWNVETAPDDYLHVYQPPAAACNTAATQPNVCYSNVLLDTKFHVDNNSTITKLEEPEYDDLIYRKHDVKKQRKTMELEVCGVNKSSHPQSKENPGNRLNRRFFMFISIFLTFLCVLLAVFVILLSLGVVGAQCSYNAGRSSKVSEVDECSPVPCKNGGTCTDLRNDYNCSCVSGWTGKACEIQYVDNCLSVPCKNGGTCTDLLNDYNCSCVPGWTGNDCNINVNECSSNPGSNGANCTDLVNEYKCSCLTG